MIPAQRCPKCGLVYSLCHPCSAARLVSAADMADADRYEVEYVETPAGDVYASALVASDGTVLSVIDDDGNDLWPVMRPEERARVEAMVRTWREERRAAA